MKFPTRAEPNKTAGFPQPARTTAHRQPGSGRTRARRVLGRRGRCLQGYVGPGLRGSSLDLEGGAGKKCSKVKSPRLRRNSGCPVSSPGWAPELLGALSVGARGGDPGRAGRRRLETTSLPRSVQPPRADPGAERFRRFLELPGIYCGPSARARDVSSPSSPTPPLPGPGRGPAAGATRGRPASPHAPHPPAQRSRDTWPLCVCFGLQGPGRGRSGPCGRRMQGGPQVLPPLTAPLLSEVLFLISS